MRVEGVTEALPGIHDGKGRRVAVIRTRWNDDIVSEMHGACLETLGQQGVASTDIFEETIPGAFEFPLACKLAAATGKFDAVIAIGCVIRGETPHFDYVAGEAARGITEAALATDVPVVFGVLTVNTEEQAWQRARVSEDNKGAEFALAALEMANVKDNFREYQNG